jgi:hypothetical protein
LEKLKLHADGIEELRKLYCRLDRNGRYRELSREILKSVIMDGFVWLSSADDRTFTSARFCNLDNESSSHKTKKTAYKS